MVVHEVLLPINIDYAFSYKHHEAMPIGSIVRAPFRNGSKIGVILGADSDEQLISLSKLKVLDMVSNIASLSNSSVELIKWIAKYNMQPLGSVLKMFLPTAIDPFTEPKAISKEKKQDKHEGSIIDGINLSQSQQDAANVIINHINSNTTKVIAIDGVTGSGKTLVYAKAAMHAIKGGKQVLILLPEIVLTTQLLERMRLIFGDHTFHWHSGLSPAQRNRTWHKVASDEAKIIIGARSALCLPYKSLGLIVVDEEHDASYKQEEGVVYNARDMAVVYASLLKIPICLVSATLSMETVYNVQLKKYDCVKLRERYGDAVLPVMQTVDLKLHKLHKNSWISLPLRTEMMKTLSNKLQSMLFINKRGYAPITMCTECGFKLTCSNCSVHMVTHMAKGIVQCHYCGEYQPIIKTCPECDAKESINFYGPGAERLSAEVSEFMPEARVLVMTSDTISTPKKAADAIKQIEQNEVDVIIGTQMIAKGLHFDNLHLVGIIEGDATLIGGDFRATERTYQLLSQVSGRAGRRAIQGLVMVQTFEPESSIFSNIIAHDNDSFWQAELEGRKLFNMPPYSRMTIVSCSGYMEHVVLQSIKDIMVNLPIDKALQVFGPSPSPIAMLKGRYRYRIIIISTKLYNIQLMLKKLINTIKLPASVKLRVDIDPYSFLY